MRALNTVIFLCDGKKKKKHSSLVEHYGRPLQIISGVIFFAAQSAR
jgi:hypothetical protein